MELDFILLKFYSPCIAIFPFVLPRYEMGEDGKMH